MSKEIYAKIFEHMGRMEIAKHELAYFLGKIWLLLDHKEDEEFTPGQVYEETKKYLKNHCLTNWNYGNFPKRSGLFWVTDGFYVKLGKFDSENNWWSVYEDNQFFTIEYSWFIVRAWSELTIPIGYEVFQDYVEEQ